MAFNSNITHVVDEIVTDLGYYNPVELLLREGRLRYSDYESWRYGQLDSIADHLMGSSKRINTLLSSARDYLLALDFGAENCEFYGWQGAKSSQLLVFCAAGSEVEPALLNTQYRRRQEVPQLDLFFDNQGVQLANELILALAGRNAELAENKLGELERVDPNNPLCGQSVKLLNALQQLEQTARLVDPLQHLHELQNHLVPLTKDLLKGKARDFLAPFWRRLALSLDTDSYTGQHPDAHPAYCYTQILAWTDVIHSIRKTAHWRQHPGLYGLLSQAFYQTQRRIESIQLLCDFCWRFPAQKPAFIMDAHSSRQWSVFLDLGLDEAWGQQHFPAWLLLHEAGLAAHIKIVDEYTNTVFSLLQQLLLEEQAGRQNIPLRKQLKAAHAGVFENFMIRLSRH